jgi:hypothetical protein
VGYVLPASALWVLVGSFVIAPDGPASNLAVNLLSNLGPVLLLIGLGYLGFRARAESAPAKHLLPRAGGEPGRERTTPRSESVHVIGTRRACLLVERLRYVSFAPGIDACYILEFLHQFGVPRSKPALEVHPDRPARGSRPDGGQA